MTQRVHSQQRRGLGGVAEVVAELTSRQAGADGGLDGDEARGAALFTSSTVERKGNAAEVRPSTDAGHHDVGRLPGHLHLALGLKADDRLMQENVVEHAAERVLRPDAPTRGLDGLRDGEAEGSRRIPTLGQRVPPGLRLAGR